MAHWQDIKALEIRIYDVVDDYIKNKDAYSEPILKVYFDSDELLYQATIEEFVAETDDVYPLSDLIRLDEQGCLEPDIDKISDIANSWIFLD